MANFGTRYWLVIENPLAQPGALEYLGAYSMAIAHGWQVSNGLNFGLLTELPRPCLLGQRAESTSVRGQRF